MKVFKICTDSDNEHVLTFWYDAKSCLKPFVIQIGDVAIRCNSTTFGDLVKTIMLNIVVEE